jgi:hypothetical protein
MKKLLVFIISLLLLPWFSGCKDPWENPNHPNAIVDFTIYPNSIKEYELNVPGGYKYYTSDPQSTSRGIIVFRVTQDSFTVWDRLPPNNPNACCDNNGNCTRLVVEDAFFVVDHCNDITYSILDGTVFEGEGTYRLYPYNYTYDGTSLRITSYYN